MGDVVGFYYGPAGTKSFFRDASGNYQEISFPGAVYTEVYGMNDLGQAVGFYYDGTTFHGFLWSGGNNFTTIDFPGANYTVLRAINDGGVIVGSFFYESNNVHGFLAFPLAESSIPEPGSVVLTLAGLAGFIAIRKRAAYKASR